MHFPSTSTVYPQPYGVAAVLAPWNYPLQLSLIPLVDAVAAGNCVALKPSRLSHNTSLLLLRLCLEVFDPRYVRCLFGSNGINDWLLDTAFDTMFFTGSARVGHEIMLACADHLTPVTLELGGKSPVFIDKTANIKRAAERIAWGKCLNSGQTCVGPDYVLIHKDVQARFVEEMRKALRRYYGTDILNNPEYAHMISGHHFDRVMGLINEHGPAARIEIGGKGDRKTLRIEPTVMTGVTLDDPVMGQEIFGPVLPLITWKSIEDAIAVTKHFGHPLACYIFSEDKSFQDRIINSLPFGGGVVNDVVIHVATNHMGFGGIGASGMGEYHGKRGFDCFTHYKSTMKKSTAIEIPIRVPPFKNKIVILRILMH